MRYGVPHLRVPGDSASHARHRSVCAILLSVAPGDAERALDARGTLAVQCACQAARASRDGRRRQRAVGVSRGRHLARSAGKMSV